MKAKTIFKLISIIGVPVTGYFASCGALKYEKYYKDEFEEDFYRSNRKDRVKIGLKAYWPAIVSGAVTIGSILMTDNISAKEIAAITAAGAVALDGKDGRIRNLKKQFDDYRIAATDGDKDADIQYMKKASESSVHGTDHEEAVHTFRVDWLHNQEPIIFATSLANVIDGLAEVNRELLDYNSGSGRVSMATALRWITGTDNYNLPKYVRAGWDSLLLEQDCDCYWLNFWVERNEKEPDIYDIKVDWVPWEDVEKTYKEAEEAGIVIL